MEVNEHNKNEYDSSPDSKPITKPTIDEVVSALQEGVGQNEHIPAAVYYGLSDLDNLALRSFTPLWNKLNADFKRRIAIELAEASEVNFDLNYEALGFF